MFISRIIFLFENIKSVSKYFNVKYMPLGNHKEQHMYTTSKHTSYWEDKSLRPYGATKKCVFYLVMSHHKSINKETPAHPFGIVTSKFVLIPGNQ